MRTDRVRAFAAAVILAALAATAVPAVADAPDAPAVADTPESRDAEPVGLSVLSNRADLISGGDALVRVNIPDGTSVDDLRVTVGRRDVTRSFSPDAPGRVTGLVKGLRLGQNQLTARLPDGRGARLTITNHPRGGPVFSGPQLQPWLCTTEDSGLGPAVDAQCNAPTQVSYLYQPEGADHGAYEPYDPANPPNDVATTRTDAGREVPYILRVEKGTLNRSIYKIIVLADPARPWTATRPQPAWNRKLMPAFGGGCGTMHKQTPPNDDALFGGAAANGAMQQPAVLAQGWMVTGTGLNTLNQNCNEVVSAEALMMLKEHIVETYGEIRRTVGIGGSGGSVQQLSIASAYPGLLDGIVPTQTFPDLWNMVWDASECYLLQHYFSAVSPHLWSSPAQQSAVTGKTGQLACGEFLALFSDAFDPQNRGVLRVGKGVRFGCELPPGKAYHPVINPTGPRCSVQDYQRAIWGSGPDGRTAVVYDNTGVQYGLAALRRGTITPEQFVDLNSKVGGFDNEGGITAERTSMSTTMAATMYRAGRTTDPRQLAQVPILDVRQVIFRDDPEGMSDMHQPYNSRVLRARLDAVNGHHGNLILWNIPPGNVDIPAVLAVDRWLAAVEADPSARPRAEKIVRNKPRDLVDTCWIDDQQVTDQAACARRYPVGSDPRIQAGSPWRQDIRKCRLKPLRRADYRAPFTDDQWSRLQVAFPSGVCDWTRPSVGYQPSIPWMTYAGGPGGQPLGRPPASVPFG